VLGIKIKRTEQKVRSVRLVCNDQPRGTKGGHYWETMLKNWYPKTMKWTLCGVGHLLMLDCISWKIQSTLDWPSTNRPQACLFYHTSIKLLISNTLVSLPILLLKHFHFTNKCSYIEEKTTLKTVLCIKEHLLLYFFTKDWMPRNTYLYENKMFTHKVRYSIREEERLRAKRKRVLVSQKTHGAAFFISWSLGTYSVSVWHFWIETLNSSIENNRRAVTRHIRQHFSSISALQVWTKHFHHNLFMGGRVRMF